MSEYEQDFREIGLVLRGFERSIDAALADGCDLLKAQFSLQQTDQRRRCKGSIPEQR